MKRAMTRNVRLAGLLVAVPLLLGLNSEAGAQGPDAAGRLKAEILASPSATQTLTAYCARLHLANPPVIRALRDSAMDRKADDRVRRLLHVTSGEPVRYR